MAEVHLISTLTGAYITLFENESISLNWRFTDISDFGTTGGFTRTFRIPYEPNQAIFDALFNVNVSPAINYFHVKMPAELRVDTIPIAVGHIRVMRVIKQLDQISDLEITFYAESPDLNKSIGNLKLKDIAALADLDHEVSQDAVVNTTQPYRYILTDRGYKWSELGEAGTRPVTSNSLSPIYPAEMTPCILWSWLFDKIITEAGFTYDATELMAILDGYVMPFINSKNLQYEIAEQEYFFRASFHSDVINPASNLFLTGLTEDYDNNGDLASDIYTAPHTGAFTFRVYATVDSANGPSNNNFYHIGLYDPNNNSPYYAGMYWYPTVIGIQNYSYDATIHMNAGDQVQLKFFKQSAFSGDLIGNSAVNYSTGTGWALIGFTGAPYGETISFALNAPDMLQIDFIKDIIGMHNLAVIPDRLIASKIQFVPMTSYLTLGNALDWTGKLDISKDIIIEPTTDFQRSQLRWTYREGSDVWNKLYKDAGHIYGDYVVKGYTVTDTATTNVFAQGDTSVQLFTSPTPCNAINGTNIVIPKFVNEQGDFVIPGPRALFLAGNADVMLYDDDTSTAQLTSVYLGNHYSSVNAQADDFDLNFAPEAPPQEITANPYKNLFNQYWRDYINEIYSENARIMRAYFALELTDVLTFTFGDRIYVKDAWWRILEISDYKVGESEVTQVTLIKIIDQFEDCEMFPVGTLDSGIVIFHNGAGEEVIPTQSCCERYGYTFGFNDNCYAFGARNRPQTNGFTQGVQGVGVSSNSGQLNRAAWIMTLASNLDMSPANIYSYIGGIGITIADGNPHSIAVGDQLRSDGAHGGVSMFGRNVYTNLPGLHLGGGWTTNDRSDAIGSAQTGSFVMSTKGGFTTSSTKLELLIEGISGNRINIPSKTGIACVITLNLCKLISSKIDEKCVSQHVVYLGKEIRAGVETAFATAVSDIIVDTSFVTPVVEIDTSTDVDEHRITVKTTGSGHPHTDCYVVATIQYTQFRHG
jgi:hypothetical protein